MQHGYEENERSAPYSEKSVTYITDLHTPAPHSSPMNSVITPPLPYRTLFTITVWLIAVLVMSSCSTAVQPVVSPERHQQTIKPIPPSVQKEKLASAPRHPNITQKKQQFFNFLKPIVIAENKKITQQRQTILNLKEKKHLNTDEQAQLRHIINQYHLPANAYPSKGIWQSLLNRIDIIPVDLALVQAANESAWGVSRFAREGNNYFGQWCFRKGCGMVPGKRARGASHEVRRFANAALSVHAYMKNINTLAAYHDLRQQRSLLRQQQQPIQAELLADKLNHYSQRGMAYVQSIQSMIRNNRKLISQTKPITATNKEH